METVATLAPRNQTQMETFLSRLESQNGRMSKTIIDLRDSRTRLLGSFPDKEAPGASAVRAKPVSLLSQLDALLSDQNDMLEQIEALAGNFATI